MNRDPERRSRTASRELVLDVFHGLHALGREGRQELHRLIANYNKDAIHPMPSIQEPSA